MKKVTVTINRFMFKILCIAMVLVIGGSLFSAGAMSVADCGMQCCCNSNSMNMQSSADKSMRSMKGCCSGDDATPCDIRKAKPYELPAMTLTSGHTVVFSADGIVTTLSDITDIRNLSGGQYYPQHLDPNFSLPPLYLQHLSFLI